MTTAVGSLLELKKGITSQIRVVQRTSHLGSCFERPCKIYMYANYLTYYSNNALWIRMNRFEIHKNKVVKHETQFGNLAPFQITKECEDEFGG